MILIGLDAKQAMPVPSKPALESSLGVYDFDCSLISYCKATKDYMVPSVWGAIDKKDDPYAPAPKAGCCNII